jgi:hypothetical protein
MGKLYQMMTVISLFGLNICSAENPVSLMDSGNRCGGDTTYHIISSAGNSFGYEIQIQDKVIIRQQSIPGAPGTKGFDKKEDAEKVAALVIIKMRRGIIPPTIEKKELDSLKVKY